MDARDKIRARALGGKLNQQNRMKRSSTEANDGIVIKHLSSDENAYLLTSSAGIFVMRRSEPEGYQTGSVYRATPTDQTKPRSRARSEMR